GGDPELKTVGETQLCQFSVATNEYWTDKDGKKQERVEWTNVVVWGRRAESCAKYLGKGHQVYVEGRKRTRKWEKDGYTFYGVDLVAEQVTFLDNRNSGSSQTDDEPPPSSPFSGGSNDDIP